MYGDKITRSMQAWIDETTRRRVDQLSNNAEHGSTPQSVKKSLRTILEDIAEKDYLELPMVAEEDAEWHTPKELRAEIARIKTEMLQAAGGLDFEKAAELRDRMLVLEKQELQLRDG